MEGSGGGYDATLLNSLRDLQFDQLPGAMQTKSTLGEKKYDPTHLVRERAMQDAFSQYKSRLLNEIQHASKEDDLIHRRQERYSEAQKRKDELLKESALANAVILKRQMQEQHNRREAEKVEANRYIENTFMPLGLNDKETRDLARKRAKDLKDALDQQVEYNSRLHNERERRTLQQDRAGLAVAAKRYMKEVEDEANSHHQIRDALNTTWQQQMALKHAQRRFVGYELKPSGG
jgi:hypothetical protein